VRAFRFLVDDQLSPEDGHIGYFCQCANPILHAFGALSGEDEFISFGVVRGQGLDSLGVAAMVELGEAEAADIFSRYGPLVEFLMFLVGLIKK
jgi:hypothetical protein